MSNVTSDIERWLKDFLYFDMFLRSCYHISALGCKNETLLYLVFKP